MLKQCNRCLETQDIANFHINKATKDGLCVYCKGCVKTYHKQYYTKNSQKVRNDVKEYRINNLDACKRRVNDYRSNHLEFCKKVTRLHYQEHKERYKKLSQTTKRRWGTSKREAKRKDREWSINIIEFEELTKRPCIYCGEITVTGGSGLDRIDNSAGYTLDNVVPCCRDCNVTRMDTYSFEEMMFLSKTIRLIKSLRKAKL